MSITCAFFLWNLYVRTRIIIDFYTLQNGNIGQLYTVFKFKLRKKKCCYFNTDVITHAISASYINNNCQSRYFGTHIENILSLVLNVHHLNVKIVNATDFNRKRFVIVRKYINVENTLKTKNQWRVIAHIIVKPAAIHINVRSAWNPKRKTNKIINRARVRQWLRVVSRGWKIVVLNRIRIMCPAQKRVIRLRRKRPLLGRSGAYTTARLPLLLRRQYILYCVTRPK